MASIALDAVSLRYFTPQGETEALRDVNLEVAEGEFVAVVGPSGCGKSTLLSLIAGLLRPTSGEVRVDGRAVTGPSRRVGYMLQQDYLFEWRDVLGNVLLGPEIQGADLAAARRRALALLERYGLAAFSRHRVTQLSGGMRQRVALARTLVIDPDVVLLDEPFSALDAQTRLALADEVGTILRREGKTVLLVTHDIGEAISMADRVAVISGRPGHVKAEHVVTFGGTARPTPFHTRERPEFNAYFDTVWREIDVHAAG